MEQMTEVVVVDARRRQGSTATNLTTSCTRHKYQWSAGVGL